MQAGRRSVVPGVGACSLNNYHGLFLQDKRRGWSSVAIYSEWERLSARIRGLITAGELHSALFTNSQDAMGAMKHLGEVARAIALDVEAFYSALEPTEIGLRNTIAAFLLKVREHLQAGPNQTQDMRQISLRTLLITVAALESEVSYLLSDHQSSIRSRTERAFEHIQRSIVVDEALRNRWQAAFDEGEVRCEMLGAVHLLSHGIWAFKVDAKGARTDLVYQEPLLDLKPATRAAEGLVLTEWKKLARGNNGNAMFSSARAQATAKRPEL
jgi:hypothetical protein